MVIEIDFAAAVFGALDGDEVPVDSGAVAVIGLFVGLAWGEVEGACDFFVEEDIAHGFEDVGVEGDGEFADVAGTFVGIENFVEAFGVVACGIDDFAVFEFEVDIFEGAAFVDGRGVVGDVAVDAGFDGGGEDFAVWDVVVAAAGDCGDIFDGEFEVGGGGCDFDLVGFFHEGFEGFHTGGHAGVVEGADFEEEVFEGFGAGLGLLGHGVGGPAEDDPFGFIDTLVLGGFEGFESLSDGFWGDVGGFEDVVGAAEGDIGVHFLHTVEFEIVPGLKFLLGAGFEEFAGDGGLLEGDEGVGSAVSGGLDEGDDDVVGDVLGVDEDAVVFLEVGGVVGENFG